MNLTRYQIEVRGRGRDGKIGWNSLGPEFCFATQEEAQYRVSVCRADDRQNGGGWIGTYRVVEVLS